MKVSTRTVHGEEVIHVDWWGVNIILSKGTRIGASECECECFWLREIDGYDASGCGTVKRLDEKCIVEILGEAYRRMGSRAECAARESSHVRSFFWASYQQEGVPLKLEARADSDSKYFQPGESATKVTFSARLGHPADEEVFSFVLTREQAAELFGALLGRNADFRTEVPCWFAYDPQALLQAEREAGEAPSGGEGA